MFKIIILFLFLAPNFVYAQRAGRVVPDMPPLQIDDVANNQRIEVVASNNRSYCCSVLRTGGDSSIIEFTGTDNFASDISIKAKGSNLPNIGNANTRWCWIDVQQNGTEAYTAVRALIFGNIVTTTSAQVWCQETSLYGNYNTSVSDFNFLEITARNALSTNTINLKVRLKSSVSGEIRNADLAINLGGSSGDTVRRDISIHDLLGNVADFGDIRITHDGSPGQVSAKLSQYDITSTSPLNFTLVGQEKFQKGN